MKINPLKSSVLLFSLCLATFNFAFADSQAITSVELNNDVATLKRGAIIYYNTCRLCHDLKYVKYQTLTEVGFSKKEIDELRGELPASTPLMSTTTNENATQIFGMIPPDLTLMAKARKQGPDYIYTLLTSYHEKEDASIENSFFSGIKMPDVMAYSVAIDESEKSHIDKKIKDVVSFLLWASDPRAEERKAIGKYVILYFLVLSGLLFVVMKRVWSRLDQKN